MKIEIQINATDFERLWVNSMQWRGQDWEKQAHRFDPMPVFTWKYAYWFDNYASLKIAQAYLNGVGNARGLSEIHSDESGGWVLLTNYPSTSWLKNQQVAVNA
jgi:hypothetical protein